MDKKALQNFALFAKDSLETQIKVSLKLLGIHSDKDIKKAYIQGDFTIIDGDSKTYPSDLKVKRDHILELIKTDGYAYTIEQFAYTWFNRLIALRFMEVHDYLPHGFKVFPKGKGSIEPEILGKLTLVEKELNLDIELCRQLKEKAQIEELYRYVLFQQCNALSGVLPMLFSKEYAYLELMLPSALLKGTTVITELIKIDESNFLDDIEVIGWLYQFYVSSDREEFRKAKIVNKDLIPTLTQIFTPDWIVRYMTENSLGRLWLESYPDSTVKKEFKYYVEDAEQTEEVKKQIESIRYKNVDPKDIKVIEPCSGSGHILVYAFDVLMLMYEEKGYSINDIPKLILDNNLFGLDVDKRASQLASFSLIMKARSIDSRFFQANRISYPKVFEIKDSKMLISMDYKKKLLDLNNTDWKKEEHLSDEELKVIDYVIETFVDGKVIGSLLKVKRENYVPLISKMNHLQKVTIRGIFNGEFVEYGLKRIVQLLRLADIMSRKYDVMITNPPYLGADKLEKECKNYAYENYPLSKADMFAMFMQTGFIKENGYVSLINPDSWMFLSSYINLRKFLFNNFIFCNMAHLGMGALEAVVQTTSFIIRKTRIDFFKGSYFKLNKDSALLSKEVSFLEAVKFKRFYKVDNSELLSIKSYPFAYWIDSNLRDLFSKNSVLSSIAETKSGLSTTDNTRFLRMWYEVDYSKIGFGYHNVDETHDRKFKWFPYNKGGEYRKWYGNNFYVVNWYNNGSEIRKAAIGASGGRIVNPDYYFKEGLSWTSLSSGKLSVRYTPSGFIFDSKGSTLFSDTHLLYILSLLNSKVNMLFMDVLCPTLDFNPGQIAKVPLPLDKSNINLLEQIAKENIGIMKKEWDSYEISWDFIEHPLIKNIKSHSIEETYDVYAKGSELNYNTIKKNEQEIDLILSKMYNFSSEMLNSFDYNDITYRLNDRTRDIKSLISFFVGLIFGRFTLSDRYFNIKEEVNDICSQVKNGALALHSEMGLNNGLDTLVIELIRLIYGKNSFKKNLDFISNEIGRKFNESSEEAINRYLYNDFINDHIKTYQKLPIYWSFDSGKKSAFKCLIYIHKYNEDTLATINSQYLLPKSTRLKYDLYELNNQLVKADDKTKRILEKEKVVLENKYNEIIEYGQVLDHMANRYISIDLDDGVKVNYEKFQGIEIVTDSGTRIKKDLLVPIK